MWAWPCSTPCATSTRSPTSASPACTRASTTLPTSSGSSPCWPRGRLPSSIDGAAVSSALPQCPDEEEAVLGEEVGHAEPGGVLVAGDGGAPGAAPGEERRDGEAPLVDDVGGQQVAVEGGAALAQRDVAVDLAQRRCQVHLAVAGPDGVDRHVGGVLGGDHEAGAAGEQRHAPVEVGAPGHHTDALAATAGRPLLLGAGGAGTDHDDVGQVAQVEEPPLVGRPAEAAGALPEGDGAVEGGDHVDQEPRPAVDAPARRLGIGLGQADVV